MKAETARVPKTDEPIIITVIVDDPNLRIKVRRSAQIAKGSDESAVIARMSADVARVHKEIKAVLTMLEPQI